MSCVRYGVLVLIFFAFSLSGCTVFKDRTYDPPKDEDVKYLLGYFQHLKEISNEELHQEFRKARQLYLQGDSDIDAIKFSLLLIYSDFTNQNQYQPADILREVSENTYNNSLKNFALLLQHILLENQKKDVLYKLTSKQLNDIIEEKREQKVAQETIAEKLHSIQNEKKKQDLRYRQMLKKLTEQEQMVEKLQKKIEELKEIERSINERKNTKAPTT